MKRLGGVILGAIAAAAVVLAVAPSPLGGQATAAPAPIKIGVVGDFTRADVQAPYIRDAVVARQRSINASGGINGRKLTLIACSTKGDPNIAAACARKMASEKVVAMFGTTTVQEAPIFPIIEQAKIPQVGIIPISTVGFASPMSFAFTPSLLGAFLVGPKLLSESAGKVKKPSLIYPTNIAGLSPAIGSSWKQALGTTKLAEGAIAGYELGATQFGTQAVQATAGGDGAFIFGAGATLSPLIKAVLQQKPGFPIGTIGTSVDAAVVRSLGDKAEGIVAVGITAPATSTRTPGIKMFLRDVNKYTTGLVRNSIAINNWMSLWVFERVAKRMKGPINNRTVYAAMSKLSRFDAGGIVPPITTTKKATNFPGFDRVFQPSYNLQVIRNGRLVQLNNNRPFYNPFNNTSSR